MLRNLILSTSSPDFLPRFRLKQLCLTPRSSYPFLICSTLIHLSTSNLYPLSPPFLPMFPTLAGTQIT